MPSIDEDSKPSWADQVEEGESGGPQNLQPSSVTTGNEKIVTTYKENEDGKKVKITRVYRMEKRKVSKTIAERKLWKKFGNAAQELTGPNPTNTLVCEDTFMQFLTANKEELPQEDENALQILSQQKNKKIMQCRACKGEHWTAQCPFKDKFGDVMEVNKPASASTAAEEKMKAGKYVAPGLRDGNRRPGESMGSRARDDTATIRVTNLSEDVRDSDLQELFKPFGQIARVYLAKDKTTGQSKGFAFINYYKREDAKKAIDGVNRHGYGNLILSVEWAKPSGSN